ncbi:MAG TPA: hypothetical protein VN285_08225 [Candidatus Deferrimicrobium sp.]|nr:hypothetical protein [Candidatus Deferrimicrobium sp.]
MPRYRAMQAVPTGVFLLILILFGPWANADSLITRDDFPCYDTTVPNHTGGRWPSIAIDSAGRLYTVNFQYIQGGQNTANYHQFNRFDRFGNQAQPVTIFLPDTVTSDSIWMTDGWYPVYCNQSGSGVIPYEARLESNGTTHAFGKLFDRDGRVQDNGICQRCEPGDLDIRATNPSGAINEAGVVVIAWQGWRIWLDARDSVFVRLYYPQNDSLSPVIEPKKLPWPALDDPDFDGRYTIDNEPAAGIADDGSFAVAWTANWRWDWIHVLYVVYNADGTPRSQVMIADCDGPHMDTAGCAPYAATNVDLAMEGDGDFYIVWSGNLWGQSYPTFRTRTHVWMRGFHPDGTSKYDAMRVTDIDSTYINMLIYPRIACDDSGNVVVCWSDSRLHPESNDLGMKYDVFVQRIDPGGRLLGHNQRVNNVAGVSGLAGVGFDCDLNNAGQAGAIWRDYNQPIAIKAQLMPLSTIGSFVPGDINYDLSGDIADVTSLVSYLFLGAKNTFWPRDLIDLDGDGSNGNIVDLTRLVDYLFLGGPPPVTPPDGIRPPPVAASGALNGRMEAYSGRRFCREVGR